MRLSKACWRISKAPIRVRVCAGWSGHLLFTCCTTFDKCYLIMPAGIYPIMIYILPISIVYRLSCYHTRHHCHFTEISSHFIFIYSRHNRNYKYTGIYKHCISFLLPPYMTSLPLHRDQLPLRLHIQSPPQGLQI